MIVKFSTSTETVDKILRKLSKIKYVRISLKNRKQGHS